jgi:hypothetical protein
MDNAPRLALRLQQCQDIILLDWTLDVPDDCSAGIVHELYANLGHTSTRAGTTKDLGKTE